MAFVRQIGPIEIALEELKTAEKCFQKGFLSDDQYPAGLPHKDKSQRAVQLLRKG